MSLITTEQFNTVLFSILSSEILIVCCIVTLLFKHSVEQFQLNSLLGGGAGVTTQLTVRTDPRTYVIVLLLLGGSLTMLTVNAI